MAYEVPLELSVLGNTLRISHPVIPSNLVTYLASSLIASGTSVTVLDNNPFAQNDYIVLGKLGLDKTEIIQISGAVTQGTALTTFAVIYDHPIDTPVFKILWNQVEISGAATVSGSKTVITTIALQPDRSDTVYTNVGTTYAYYFVRYKNSTTAAFSSYSSAALATGYPTNSVRAAKKSGLSLVNEKVDTTLITDEFLNTEIFNCEQEVWSEKKQWSWAYTYNKIIGQTVTGGLSIALPADIGNPNSNQTLVEFGIRIGGRTDMTFVTKEEWDQFFVETFYSTVSSAVTIGDVVINVTSVNDFDTSGSVVIGTDSSINYTGVDTTLNQLTGVTGIAANHIIGEYVWQQQTFSEPVYFTIFNGKIYFQAGVDVTYAGKNVYCSYYRYPTPISGDSDTLNIPDFTIYHYYLAWKILLKKNNGLTTQESERMYQEYDKRKANMKRIDRTGQRVLMRPRTNKISYPRTEVKTSFLQSDF